MALSLGMLASFYEYPTKYGNNQSIDWNNVKLGYSEDNVAQLLAFIGEKLNTEYSLNNSTAQIKDLKNAFNSLSYNYEHVFYPISSNNPAMMLFTHKKPLLALGVYGNNIGHAWVIDGSLQVNHDPDAFIGGEVPDPKMYLHCVWGDYGRGNGYFLYDKLGNLGGSRNSTYPSDGVYPGYPDFNTVDIFEDVTVTYEYTPIKIN